MSLALMALLGVLLLALAFALGRLSAHRPPVDAETAPESPVLVRARALTAAADRLLDASGEYKRHQVYARLIKEFPMERRRNISKAIEAALLVLLLLACAVPASAQSVVNPTRVEFTSPDHGLVTEYEIGYFAAGATAPQLVASLGRPDEVGGLVAGPVAVKPLALGAYTARVRAKAGTAISEWSPDSNPFARSLLTPAAPVVK